ncbi:hypothetical protein BJF80_07330 [Serinicoccus sp. CUA-874]|uniref:hypothetical protein n=1 Tax=Serinicoccus sp. CUA-874 TaxID=1517939 RepID=UPI0009689F5D|nr:hypothetical protein [Serinicoccus sp. CUA-874]OLT16366.1 hypothetical protein BJF80_07330 [Serinicoccus sp. CUA-874]
MTADPSPQPATDGSTPRDSDALGRELEAMLVEAEETAGRLRAELAAYRARREEEGLHTLQHLEVDRLEEHLRNSRIRWDEVRAFLEEALRELGWGADRSSATATDVTPGSDPGPQAPEPEGSMTDEDPTR